MNFKMGLPWSPRSDGYLACADEIAYKIWMIRIFDVKGVEMN
jgi:hypothetical protein